MQRMLIMFACYRLVALPSIIITLITSGLLGQSGTPFYLVQAIWTKVITTALLLAFVHFFRSNHFFFFNNLGQSRRAIYWNLIIPDVLICAASFSLVLML